ncbi:MAG TPA: MarR family winged helix-turn-helix transcriptional regulator [Ferruginibacter sp.]|nr:MarR family winged helix-turn-helix transcriptional regulator [Ferruginibacter sp.]HMP19523.1 MarR family winged helix-turn-helix transcriptional regulator [Ferruginibacter sp.]
MKASESRFCQCLYFSSNAFARKVEKLAAESWKRVELSPSHAYLLLLAIEEPGIQPSTIVNHLLLTPSTITRLIEKLEGKKLVVRTNEGKITNIYPTPKAKAMLPELKDCLAHFYQAYTAILGKEESSKMVGNMNKLVDRLPE